MSLTSAPHSPSKPTADKRRETAERMRKWRASNAEKSKPLATALTADRDNDTRCRVYRVARERFGLTDSPAKAAWIHDEILRRTERRRVRDAKKSLSASSATSPTQLEPASRPGTAPLLPPLSDPTPYNPIHLPSMEPPSRPTALDYTSSQALSLLNHAAVHFLIA